MANTFPAPDAGAPNVRPDGDALAERLLRQGKFRAALNRAKTVYKTRPTPAAERLLAQCYAARIRELRSGGHAAEAEQLEAFVKENIPGWDPVLLAVSPKRPAVSNSISPTDAAVPNNSFDRLGQALSRLADAAAPEEEKRKAEKDVARLAFDPMLLAKHPAMTAGHPLAAAAKAIADGFSAVVSRPVDESEISLPDVTRRSPLAGWKLLIRAVAHLQRREDKEAGRALDGLAGLDCAAARLVPPLRAVIAGAWDKLDGVEKRIFSTWRPREKRLPEALRRLDAAFFVMLPKEGMSFALMKQARKREKDLHAALRNAAEAVRLEAPALTAGFREAAATKMLVLPDIPLFAAEKSLGGPAVRTASFWRLAAIAVEERIRICRDAGDFPELRDCWTAFIRHGVAEGLFPAGGAEEAEIWLHLADMTLEYGVCDSGGNPQGKTAVDMKYCYDSGQPAAVLALAPAPESKPVPVDPMAFFAKAAKANPTPELFRSWLDAARRLDAHGGWRIRGSDKNQDYSALVLAEWTSLLPGDPTPNLILMDEAERRNALSLAQKHLAVAEAIDPLNADLTRAKWRLALAMCRRHLKQGKAHLVEADLKKLDALRRFGPANAGWLLIGLRWLLAATITKRADELHAELVEAAGGGDAGEGAAGLLEQAIGVHSSAEFFIKPRQLLSPPLKKTKDIVFSTARVFRLLTETGFGLAWGKKSPWPAWIASVKDLWPRADLPAVIQSLLPEKFFGEAFVLTSSGLADAGQTSEAGRLLLMRAVILQEGRTYQQERILRCVCAAVEIGRRTGDRGLTAEAVAWMQGQDANRRLFFSADYAAKPMTDDELVEVLEIERSNDSFPKAGSVDPHADAVRRRQAMDDDIDDFDDEADPDCQCPECRRARGEPPLPPALDDLDVGTAVRDLMGEQVSQYAEHIASLLREIGFSGEGAGGLADMAAPEVMLALVTEQPVGENLFDFFQINPNLREKCMKIVSELPDADRRLFEDENRRAAARRASRPKKNKRGRRNKR